MSAAPVEDVTLDGDVIDDLEEGAGALGKGG